LPENWQVSGFGLYVHWPYCLSKCPYCDFNSHVSGVVDQNQWLTAFRSEIQRLGEELPGRRLRSIYFGGGTPSLMKAETVEGILSAARKAWSFDNDIEITLEANPSSVEATRFADYRSIGVNRVSLGIQALDDGDLQRLGRLHTVSEALSALEIAQSTFDRVSFDLIYARQDQNEDSWQNELRYALSLGVNHLSLYQLTVEKGTAFFDRAKRGGLKGLPDEELGAELFQTTYALTEAAGFTAYEVSNHAKSGNQSAHNMLYWRGGDYAGVGPGAHGRITNSGMRIATVCFSDPLKWLNSVENHNSGEEPRQSLARSEWLAEILMMGMRTDEGVAVDRLLTGEFEKLSNNIKHLKANGLLKEVGTHIQTTFKGRLLLNSVISELLSD